MKTLIILLITILTLNVSAQNIALNKPVRVSSLETPTFLASSINDGYQTTRWSSKWLDNEWVIIDLGSLYNINLIRVNWENARAKAYQILTSDDTLTWRVIYSNTADFPKGIYNLSINGYGRYVKLIGLTRATMYGLSIYELEVYGSKRLSCGQCKSIIDSLSSLVKSLTIYSDSLKIANYNTQYKLAKLRQSQFMDSIEFIGFNDTISGTFTKLTEKEYNIIPKFSNQILTRYPINTPQGIKTKEITITELKR